MSWFRSRQTQRINDTSVTDSTIQQTSAGRDALSFQNSEQVTIVYNGLFGSRQVATGIDWEWAGRVIVEQQAEVRNRLKYVLGDRSAISVQMTEQPEWVNLPVLESRRRLTISGQESELLDPGKLMIEVFGRDDIAGKLLILGTPGAGKTTVLLSLAEQLLAGARDNPKTVIPIVFELSTWKNDNQSIHDWLIEQLYDLYGGDPKRTLKRYEQWLDQRVLLPLLDGLDELGMERQKKCMAKLNEFTKHYPQVVVCCRSKEFEESGIRLKNLRGAVGLEPLSDRQIQTYLQQVEREGLWTQIQETPEMRQMLEPNEDGEAGLLRVPLFVSIAASIYDANQPFRTKGELLERYIDRQLSFDVRMSDRRRGLEQRKWAYATVEREPTVKLTQHYLAWVARRLNGMNEVNFLIEKMQPSWLEKPQHKRLYRLIVGLSVGLIVGLIVGSLVGLIVGLIVGLVFGLPSGLVVGFISMLSNIQPVESFQILISTSIRQEVIRGLKFKFLAGLTFGLIFGLILGLIVELLGGLIVGLIFGLFFGLSGGLISGLKQELTVRSKPSQGIQNSFYNFFFSSIVAISFANLFFSLLVIATGIAIKIPLERLLSRFIEEFPNWFIIIFSAVIIATFQGGGGQAFVQHFCLRFVLARSGSFPFFCVPFLNYCTERRLLQRIGGRYRFIHRELLEHFAKQRGYTNS